MLKQTKPEFAWANNILLSDIINRYLKSDAMSGNICHFIEHISNHINQLVYLQKQ